MTDHTVKGATFSPCRTWRYSLWRIWENSTNLCAFIGLNPSTADEHYDDPTIRRCVNFAKAWGHSGLVMLNIFAFRATDPRDMYAAPDPIGPDNNETLIEQCNHCTMVVVAWGTHGHWKDRGFEVKNILQNHVTLWCLGLTKAGYPVHPLYQPKDAKPIIYMSRVHP